MVTFLNICEKIDRVIRAPHCMCAQNVWIPERNRIGSPGGPRGQKSTALDTTCERVISLARKVNNVFVFYCILEEYIALISAGKGWILLCPNTAILCTFSFSDGGHASHHLFTNRFIAAVISKRLPLKFLWTKAIVRPTFKQYIYVILL